MDESTWLRPRGSRVRIAPAVCRLDRGWCKRLGTRGCDPLRAGSSPVPLMQRSASRTRKEPVAQSVEHQTTPLPPLSGCRAAGSGLSPSTREVAGSSPARLIAAVVFGDRSSVGRARVCLAIPLLAPLRCGPTVEAYRHSRSQVRSLPVPPSSTRHSPLAIVGSVEESLATIRPCCSARAAG